MMEIITRSNWKEHKKEPYLNAAEQMSHNTMSAAALEDEELFEYLHQRTAAEERAAQEIEATPLSRYTWATLRDSSDAYCRLQRAELAAWREWLARSASRFPGTGH